MSTDQYTPTKNEARLMYAVSRDIWHSTGTAKAEAEFDRFISAHDAETRRDSIDMFIDWIGSLSEDHPRYSEINGMVVLMAMRFRNDNFPTS